MLGSEVLELIDEEMSKIKAIFDTKGHDYTRGDNDQLINFKRNAQRLELTPFQVFGVYWAKHVDRVFTFLKEGSVKGETVQESIRDIILYNFLLLALIEERRQLEDMAEDVKELAADAVQEYKDQVAAETGHKKDVHSDNPIRRTPDGKYTSAPVKK